MTTSRLPRWGIGLGACLAASLSASAQPPLKAVTVATGLENPLYVTHAPGDFHRVFIVEQGMNNGVGRIKILNLDTMTVNAAPFLSIDPVANTNVEQGLLGLVFHPDYANNGYFYVYYTAPGPFATFVRYTVSKNPDIADPDSARIFLKLPSVGVAHNGGWMGFGPDGMLYAALGDNTDIFNGQNLNTLRGKIIRIDVNGDDFPADPERNYAIPSTNPYVGLPGEDEIWALGLRNPWRCSFDRATGDLWIGDVGQSAWEEVNFLPAPGGAPFTPWNFGWVCFDGIVCTMFCGASCTLPNYRPAIHAYPHEGSICRAVTGGYVYRGCAIPNLQGTYFFADFCTAQVWSLRYNGFSVTEFTERTRELDPEGKLLFGTGSFGEDAYGELYICNLWPGTVLKIVPDAPASPDCNGNGVRDACDILAGTSPDVNVNGIPDECEGCYADCTGDGQLTIADFGCFQTMFVQGDPYADCNGDAQFTIADFACFQTRFVQNCP